MILVRLKANGQMGCWDAAKICQDLPSHAAREWTAKEIFSRRCSQCEDTHHQRLWHSEPSGHMTWELVAGFCPVIFVHCVKLIASWNILCQIVKCGESDGIVGICRYSDSSYRCYSDFVRVQSVEGMHCR